MMNSDEEPFWLSTLLSLNLEHIQSILSRDGNNVDVEPIDNLLNRELASRLDSWLHCHLDIIDSRGGKVMESESITPSGESVEITEAAVKHIGQLYALLVLSHYIPVVNAVILICKSMRISYLASNTSIPLESTIFPNESFLISFICTLIEKLLPLIKGLGNDMIAEVIRFGTIHSRYEKWAILKELQNQVEPWDNDNGCALPHSENLGADSADLFQRSLPDERESKLLDFSGKVDVNLVNQRKKIFDKFSDLLKRFQEVLKSSSSPLDQRLGHFIQYDLSLSGKEILSLDSKNLPWIAQLFLEKYIQHTIQQQLQFRQDKDQVSYMDKLLQTLQSGSNRTVHNETIIKLEKRFEASSPTPTTPLHHPPSMISSSSTMTSPPMQPILTPSLSIGESIGGTGTRTRGSVKSLEATPPSSYLQSPFQFIGQSSTISSSSSSSPLVASFQSNKLKNTSPSPHGNHNQSFDLSSSTTSGGRRKDGKGRNPHERSYSDRPSPMNMKTGGDFLLSNPSLVMFFPGMQAFFACFIQELNHHAFNQYCISAIFNQLSHLTQYGHDDRHDLMEEMVYPNPPSINQSFHKINHDPIHFTQIISKLKSLGSLLGFLHFHHLPIRQNGIDDLLYYTIPPSGRGGGGGSSSGGGSGNNSLDSTEIQSSLWMSKIPFISILDAAWKREERLCLEVTWIVSFFLMMSSFHAMSFYRCYHDVFDHLFEIEVHFLRLHNLSRGEVSSNRLWIIMQIQSLWKVYPSVRKHAQKCQDLSHSILKTPGRRLVTPMTTLEHTQWKLQSYSFQHVSRDLFEQFHALRSFTQVLEKRCPPAPSLQVLKTTEAKASPINSSISGQPSSQPRKPRRQTVVPVNIASDAPTVGNISGTTLMPFGTTVPGGTLPRADSSGSFASIVSDASKRIHSLVSPEKKLADIASDASAVCLSSEKSSMHSMKTMPRATPKKKISSTSLSPNPLSATGFSSPLRTTDGSPALSSTERKRATSTSSSQAFSLEKRRAGNTLVNSSSMARNLFPDEGQTLLKRMEESYWNQHFHLQRVHAFLYTNSYHAAVAQIKEFVVVSLRRILDEVDNQNDCWKLQANSTLNGSDVAVDDEKGQMEAWVQYYLQEMLSQGKPVIDTLYEKLLPHLPMLYSQYPENPRVIKLAVHHTRKHLHSQQSKMHGYLKDYANRKLRELQDRKKKSIVSLARKCRDSSGSSQPTSLPTVLSSSNNLLLNLSDGQDAKSRVQNLASSLFQMGCLKWKENSKHKSNEELDYPREAEWSFLPQPTTRCSTDLITFSLLTLQQLTANYFMYCFHVSKMKMEWTKDQDSFLTMVSAVYEKRESVFEEYPANDSMVSSGDDLPLQSLQKLWLNLGQYLADIILSKTWPDGHSISAESKGRLNIEVTMNLITTLPFLLSLDYFAFVREGAVSFSGDIQPLSELMVGYCRDVEKIKLGELPSDIVLSFILNHRILSIDSFFSILMVLQREKSGTFYEQSKGIPAGRVLIAQGMLLLLGRFIIYAGKKDNKQDCPWYEDSRLVESIRSSSCSRDYLTLMDKVAQTYATGSDPHRCYHPPWQADLTVHTGFNQIKVN